MKTKHARKRKETQSVPADFDFYLYLCRNGYADADGRTVRRYPRPW